MSVLEDIVQSTAEAVKRRERQLPLSRLESMAREMGPGRSLSAALRRPGKGGSSPAALRVIGEIKRRSPSSGSIREELDAPKVAAELESAGCAALSVLTEELHFGGSLDDLRAVRQAVELPLLRKDFILGFYQIVEARAHGADAVLLLAALHDDESLLRLARQAASVGMEVLAEAHGEDELERLLRLELPLLGINARDLRSFRVDVEAALAWAPRVPVHRVLVAESGVRERSHAQRVGEAPVDATLVGEGLMRGATPRARFDALFGSESR